MSGRCCSHGAAVAATAAAALRWWLSTATIARISGEPHNCIVLPSLETHFSVSLDIYLLYSQQSSHTRPKHTLTQGEGSYDRPAPHTFSQILAWSHLGLRNIPKI